MRWAFTEVAAIAALLQVVTALPTSQNVWRKKPTIVKSTTLPDGQIIDWALRDSQVDGTIATPPAPPANRMSDEAASQLAAQVLMPLTSDLQGPEGTVPILRRMNNNKLPQKTSPLQSHPPTKRSSAASAEYSHWYAFTANAINNNGGGANFSLFNPHLETSNDFSLIQTAVAYDNAATSKYGSVIQTVEAGWQNYPYMIAKTHLFTYYTTCGYTNEGDNIGGYNTDQEGWVQTDNTIYPGYQFTPYSVDGGAQYDLHIEYKLMNGNWWLFVLDRYIGYYPASLFSNGNANAAKTLSNGSNRIAFYGEVYNSETHNTTTDMGSGEYPSAGYGKSAYIRNIVYTDNSGTSHAYTDNQETQNTYNGYRLSTFYNSGTSFGSYILLGGPGSDGKIGSK